MENIATLEKLTFIGKLAKLHRLFAEEGLPEEALQWPIDDVDCRKRLVGLWKNRGISDLVRIDRSKPFDPVCSGSGQNWKIVEEDERSLTLTVVDLSAIKLTTMLEGDENYVDGEERLSRLKRTGHIRLDAKIFQTLWENQYLIPTAWKEKTEGKMTCIDFTGTVLEDPYGYRFVLLLYWIENIWGRGKRWLGSDYHKDCPSAVL